MTHPLKGRVDDVEHSLALLVHALDLDQVDARLGVERAGEAATPKRTTVAFDSVASLRATGHEAHEGLVVEQDGDLLTNLHDEDVSNWSAFRLRLSRCLALRRHTASRRKRCAGELRLAGHHAYLDRDSVEATRRRHGGCGGVGGRHACCLNRARLLGG